MWSRLSEYEELDDRESSKLTLAFVKGGITFGEYERRQRELSNGIAGSTPYVLFMATILPAADWVRAASRGLRRPVAGCRR